MTQREWIQPAVLSEPPAKTVRVVELAQDQAPPIPEREPIDAWLAAYRRNPKNPGPAPEGLGAGHYQRIVIELDTGVIRFSCGDWRNRPDEPAGEVGAALWAPSEWAQVPRALYWVIDSGVPELPYLTVEEGNALAHRLAPVAQRLLDGLVEVPGTDFWDWSPQSAQAGAEVSRGCYRSPDLWEGNRLCVSMEQVVEACPEVVSPGWAQLTDERLDDEARTLTALLGSNEHWHPELRQRFGIPVEDVYDTRFEVVGTRAWLYRHRQERAANLRPVDADRWITRGRSRYVDLDDEQLQEAAQRLQSAAAEEGVLLVGLDAELRARRAEGRRLLVEELKEFGDRRVKAEKSAQQARGVVNARILQIIAWADPNHSNYAQLGSAARMTRQAVSKMASDFIGSDSDADQDALAGAE